MQLYNLMPDQGKWHDSVWVCDLTYICVESDFNYLFLITGAHSRMIVGVTAFIHSLPPKEAFKHWIWP